MVKYQIFAISKRRHGWANLKQAIKLNKHKFENFETNLASQMQNMNHSNMVYLYYNFQRLIHHDFIEPVWD